MKVFTSMQQMVDCGLNAWAFTLVAESYLRVMTVLSDRLTAEQRKMQVTMKGVTLTLEMAPTTEQPIDDQSLVSLEIMKKMSEG